MAGYVTPKANDEQTPEAILNLVHASGGGHEADRSVRAPIITPRLLPPVPP